MRHSSLRLLAALTLLAPALCGTKAFADGPTPFPDPKDDFAWPGEGPIRVGPWMIDNRKYFWSQRDKDQGAVVFIGDSLIAGYKPSKDFPDLKVANRGIGGEVTRGLLFRLKEDVIDLNPRAVVMCYGSNDLSCRTNPDLAVSNIAAAIEQLREAHPKLPIVLCLVPPREAPDAPITEGSLERLNDGLKSVAEGKENIVVVDIFTPLATPDGKPNPEFFGADKIHPNAAGYARWTEQLAPAFEKLGIK